jgi:hypothetical protein
MAALALRYGNVGKDRRRDDDGEDNDSTRLKQLAKLMRGVKPKQRNKFHDTKSKRERTMRDVANEYNRDGEVDYD